MVDFGEGNCSKLPEAPPKCLQMDFWLLSGLFVSISSDRLYFVVAKVVVVGPLPFFAFRVASISWQQWVGLVTRWYPPTVQVLQHLHPGIILLPFDTTRGDQETNAFSKHTEVVVTFPVVVSLHQQCRHQHHHLSTTSTISATISTTISTSNTTISTTKGTRTRSMTTTMKTATISTPTIIIRTNITPCFRTCRISVGKSCQSLQILWNASKTILKWFLPACATVCVD